MTSTTISLEKNHWRLKTLLLCHILGALLLTSLFWPITKGYWDIIDVSFFKMVNSTLRDRPLWQLFWACANHKWADWIEDVVILCFFIIYVKTAAKALRARKIAELIFCALWIAAILYFVNRLLFRENLEIPRLSPTLVVHDSVRLSDEITWMSIKDGSSKSFPGDHGTTAILFASAFSYLAGWRLGVLACLYGAFLCMPRLITGAHWFSDIVVGSGAITLICLSWAFCSPIFIRFTDWCEGIFSRKS